MALTGRVAPAHPAGPMAHGVCDLVHCRLDRVVPRPWAEWCGVVDILGAAAILFLPWQ
jgi:hypothetical protein